MENPFVKLFAIDFKDHLEVKKSGNTELKYVSWAYAWAEVKKLYPAASYEVKKFNGLPYVYDPITGFMVYTSVTIEGVSHEMWLPVLDSSNKAMKAVPYTYTTPKWDYNPQTRRREKIGMEERTVEAASMFDVNKAIMRCLVKNLAMFGLGLYVYAGEDLPEDAAPQPEAEPQSSRTEICCPEAGTAACALHLCPVQPAYQEGQAEGRFYHAGGRVCSHP